MDTDAWKKKETVVKMALLSKQLEAKTLIFSIPHCDCGRVCYVSLFDIYQMDKDQNSPDNQLELRALHYINSVTEERQMEKQKEKEKETSKGSTKALV